MENTDGPISFEETIRNAATGDDDALCDLIAHRETEVLLNRISAWAERKYNQPKDDVRQVVFLALFLKVTTIGKPSRRKVKVRTPRKRSQPKTWREHLEAWCRSTAKYYCLNQIVRSRREKNVLEEMNHRNQGIRRKTGDGSQIVQPVIVITPDQQFAYDEGLRRIKAKFPPRIVEIIDLWALGMTPNEIAKATKKSPKTIYPILKEIQKAFNEETGLEPLWKRKRLSKTPKDQNVRPDETAFGSVAA